MTTKTNEISVDPIVINMGSLKKRKAKLLKKGELDLASDVKSALQVVKENVGEKELANKVLAPVVLVYKEKARKSKIKLPFLF